MQKMKITFNGYITVEDENGNKIDIETGSKKHKCCGNSCSSKTKEKDVDLTNLSSEFIKKPDLKHESIFDNVFKTFFKPKDTIKEETKSAETKKTVSCSSEEREALYNLDPKVEEEKPKVNIESMIEVERKAFEEKLESMLNRVIPAIEKLTSDVNALKDDYKKTENDHVNKYLSKFRTKLSEDLKNL